MTVEECEDLECITSWSDRRRSRECRSGNSHFEWPPMIMGFIHAKNVCQKEVITFSSTHKKRRRRWRSSSHHSKKIPHAMRNMKNSILEEPLIHLIIWIRNDDFMNEEDDEAEGSRRSLPMKKIKISIQLSFHDIVLLCNLFIFSWCIMHDRMLALMTAYY